MVTIEHVGNGTCVWCLESAEGVEAKFKDGLQGFLCKKHFWQALQIRSAPRELGDRISTEETNPKAIQRTES